MATQALITDQETRQRLLEAAARLFAERGFQHVTVRDICGEAGANVAAVNYYFRDKAGLYQDVIHLIIRFMKETFDLAHAAPESDPPQKRLRHYIRVYLQRILRGGQNCWQGRLMAREMADPSPALDLIVEQAIRPNSARVGAVISKIMGVPASDSRVGICVASIQTQMVGLASPVAVRMVPGMKFTPEIINFLAEHVAEFSLGGIRAVSAGSNKVRIIKKR